MARISPALLLLVAVSLCGCAAVSVVGGVASLGVGTVTTAGSIALTGVDAAARAGGKLLPSGAAAPVQPENERISRF